MFIGDRMRICIECGYDCKHIICAHRGLHTDIGGCNGECSYNKLSRCVEVGYLLVWDEVDE